MSVRVRFAPSNTGTLHMGGARTALFNYLYAKNQEGTFILRIEDTDRERSKEEYTESIIEALDWLGMEPDEGPILQTSRLGMYRERIDALLEAGHAYRCYCTPEELEAQREEAIAEGRKPKYSREWRDRTDYPDDKPYTVRIKMPLEGTITINDMVQGEVTVDVDELDDFIIMRSDGTPTYNFVVVVDDADMDVTHVIRGDDHLNNTFRQVPVYRALGLEPPTFGHLPLISGLSKRKGSASVQDYRDDGFLAEAVVNYISRLGWSHGDQELFSMDELIEFFGFDSVGKSPSNFDRDKLTWVNTEWLKRLEASELASRLLPFLERLELNVEAGERLTKIADLMRDRGDTLVEIAEKSTYFFSDDFEYNEKAVKKWMKPASAPAIEAIIERLEALDTWDGDAIGTVYREAGKEFELGLAKLAQPTRIALTGATSSPSVFDLVASFPKEEALKRLRRGAELFDADGDTN